MFRLADSWVMSRGPQSTQGILRPTVTCRLAGQAASPVGRKLEIGGAHRLQFCPNGYSLESRLSFTTPAPSQGQNAPAPKRCGVDAAFPFMRQAFLAAKRGTLAGRFARQRRTPGCGWRRRESAPKNRHRASTAQVKALCTMDQLKTIKGFCGKSTVAVLALLKLLNRNFSLDNGGSEARWGDAEMPDEILLHC